jgi:hypothetical protein
MALRRLGATVTRSSPRCLDFDSDCVNLRTPLGQSQLQRGQQLPQFGGGGCAGYQQAPLLILQWPGEHMGPQVQGDQVLYLVQTPSGFADALLQ